VDGRVLRAQRAKRARREVWRHRWDFWKRITLHEVHLKSVRELTRALEAGYTVLTEGPMMSLQIESLEPTMRLVTFSDSHIKLHRAKLAADAELA